LISAVGHSADDVYEFEYLNDDGLTSLKSHKSSKKTIDYTDDFAASGAYSRDLPSWAQQSKWSLPDFSADEDVMLDPAAADIHEYSDVLDWCMDVLDASPNARLMMDEAFNKGWKISLEDLQGGEYCLDVEEKTLLLDNNALEPSALTRSRYFRNVTIVTLVKALRDIWQERRHGGFDEYFRPEHIMTLERVRAADCDVMTLLVGWELRSAKHCDIWRHLIGSENGDMAMLYSGHLERDPTSGFNGYALAATFRQWFRDKARVNSCDHDTLEYLDEVLSVGDAADPFGKKKPSRMNIEVLSCLPDKTAYLQGVGGEILSDPLYCGMDDPINQTHLFHILYDLEVVLVNNVPFRDAELARKIFPI